MMAQILYAFVGLIVLGTIMLVIGLRGKRLNDHPVCRGCGFDLEGVLPAGVTCPECGAGLKRAKAVRQGARRKRWVVAGLGLILMLLPLAAFLLVGGAILSGSDVNKYKPVALLMLESRLAGPTLQQAAAKELLDRLRNNTLTAEQIKGAVGEAMAIQADLKRRWFNEWGDIVEEAHLQGKVSKDDYQLFMDQSAVLDCKVRPTVEKGEAVPVVIKLKEARAGSGSQFMVSIMLDEATIAGKAAQPESEKLKTRYWPLVSPADIGGASLMGRLCVRNIAGRSNVFASATKASATLQPDNSLNLADLPVVLRLRRVGQIMGADWTSGQSLLPNSQQGELAVVRLETRMVRSDQPTVRLLDASNDKTLVLADALTPRIASQAGPNVLFLIFRHVAAGVPFAFDVYARSDGKERCIGHLTSGDGVSNIDILGAYSTGAFDSQLTIMANSSVPFGKLIDLVFRPSAEVARHTVDLEEIYGGEVTVKGVQIDGGQR